MYNGAERVERCIKSILAQTYPEIELIITDDGSKDKSYEIAQKTVEKFNRNNFEIVLSRQENQGVAVTRNNGILKATGDYITFVDQDDYLEPQYCEEYMSVAITKDADIVVGGYQRITDYGKVTRAVKLTKDYWSKFIVMAPWAHIYKREMLLKHGIEFLTTGIGEDVYFNMLAYAATESVEVIPSDSYLWVNNPESVSNSKQNTINEKVNPIFLLDSIVNKIPNQKFLNCEEVEYYFLRYVCWYMLFSSRGSKKANIEDMGNNLLCWLKRHYPNYRHNYYMGFGKPKGEPFSIRASVWFFYHLERIGLLLPILKCFGVKN